MIGRMKILIAGGSGLVGTNLTKRLVREGADVLASYCTHEPRDHKEVSEKFDFTNFDDCLRATQGKDCVFFCAAQITGAQGAVESPTSFILPNLRICAGLLEACRINK